MASSIPNAGKQSINGGLIPKLRSGRLVSREPQYKKARLAELESENNKLLLEIVKLRRERDRLRRLVYKNRVARAKAKEKAQRLAATAARLRESFFDVPPSKPGRRRRVIRTTSKPPKPQMLQQIVDYSEFLGVPLKPQRRRKQK